MPLGKITVDKLSDNGIEDRLAAEMIDDVFRTG
jgi:hypothetical protein